MKIAVVAGLFAEWYVNVDAHFLVFSRSFQSRNAELITATAT